jgi:hypothetical protein
MIATLVGTVLALAALAYVLYPLLRESDGHNLSEPVSSQSDDTGEMTAVDALREIEFDYATGKLSDGDYRALKTSYMRDAAAELADSAKSGRACPACGARPEANAAYCSNCGHALAA